MEFPKYAGLLRGRHFLNTNDFTQEDIKQLPSSTKAVAGDG